MRNLFIDLDGVVFDTDGTILDISNYLRNNCERLGLSIKDIPDASWVYLYSNYDKVKIYKDFYEVFDLLRDSYDITFVSMYVTEEEYAYKDFFARSLDTKIILLSTEEYADKSSVDMSGGIFLDNEVNNVCTSNAEDKYLYSSRLSKLLNFFRKEKFSRVSDWVEVGISLGVLDGKEEKEKTV